MITTDERDALRRAGLAAWQRANDEPLERLVRGGGDEESAKTLERTRRAIERLLRDCDMPHLRFSLPSTRPAVIVADDRVVDRVLLVRALRQDRRMHVVADAVDGAEAVAAAIVHQPDVVVLDDRLMLVPGLDVAAQLRLYAPQTRSVLLLDPSDPLFDAAPPSVVDAVVSRYEDRRHLVDVITRVAEADDTARRASFEYLD